MKRAKPTTTTIEQDDQQYSSEEDGVPERAAFCFGGAEMPACLTRELNNMPMPSREQVGHDIFGISEVNDIPMDAIEQMEQEIKKVKRKAAYELAMDLSPEYVTHPRRALSFLRAVEGDPKRGAKRLIRHFETKLELFGADKLVKDIELSDFDPYDMEALRSGGFQVLPQKDRAGRPILFGRYTCMKYREIKNMVGRTIEKRYENRLPQLLISNHFQLRALWYTWSTIVEEEAHQRSGIIAIGYENGRLPLERYDQAKDAMFDMHAAEGGFDRELARGILSIPLSLPIRPVGYHICADSTQWQGISDMVMVTVCKFVRLRMRFHYGKQIS